jgi:hypothetical protein
LEKGSRIHANNDEALGVSAQNGHVDVVRFLLENGANIHANNDSALRRSAKGEHVDVVRLLLKKGANPNVIMDLPIIRYRRVSSLLDKLTKKNLNSPMKIEKSNSFFIWF